jgi:site-specific DNA recombinase
LLGHPRTVYLREADLLPHLDGWLTGLFDPPTSSHPRRAHRRQLGRQRRRRALRKVERTLADCQRNLARYRAALDAEAMISARSVQLMARQESV